MNKYRVLLTGFAFLAADAPAQIGPGWHTIDPPVWTSPVAQAGDMAANSESNPAASSQGGGASQSMPVGNAADEVTPEIQALADSLGHDQNRIFEWVRNRITFKLYYGVKKGASLTLLEESGNDADTSALLVALLRASGIPARYVWGYTVMPLENGGLDWAHYLKLTPRDRDEVFGWLIFRPATEAILFQALAGAGMSPSHVIQGGTVPSGSYGIRRCCVAVPETNGGYSYLDPSLKLHQGTLADLGDYVSFSDYSRSDLLTEAGGISVTNGIKNLDQTKIENYLSARAKTFSTWAAAAAHTEGISGLIGGWHQDDMSFYSYFPAPYYPGADHPVEPVSDVLPLSLFVMMHIKLVQNNVITVNQLFFWPSLKGKNLHLWFQSSVVNGSQMTQGQLYLDDALIQSELEGSGYYPVNTDATLTTTIIHPQIDGSASFLDQSFERECKRYGTYGIVSCCDMSEGWLRKRQAILDNLKAPGQSIGDRILKSEALNVIGLQWLLQTERASNLLEIMFDEPKLNHHRVGIVSDEYNPSNGKGGAVVDVLAQISTTIYRNSMFMSFASASVGSAMEHGVLAQLQNGTVAASTMSVIAAANAAGNTLYLANNGNWSSVSSSLSGYTSSQLSEIGGLLSVSGAAGLVPQSGAIGIGSWQGYGLSAQMEIGAARSVLMLIGGGLNGGHSGVNSPINAAFVQDVLNRIASVVNAAPTTHPITHGGDPVDMASGHFTYQHTDLSIDGGVLPEGVSFTRTYHGSRRLEDRDNLSHGWTHNLTYQVAERSNVESALGTGNAAQAASALIGLWILGDICYNRTTAKDWAVSGLVANWLVNSLVNNTVSITAGDRVLEFQRIPGGLDYLPPPGLAASLTRVESMQNSSPVTIWEITEKHGGLLRITQEAVAPRNSLSVEVISADGTSGTIVYDGTNIRATDYLGRWIQVNLDVSQLDILNLTDSTGRQVTYTRDASGNLTGGYDAVGSFDILVYDAAQRLIEVKSPLGQSIVRNTVFDVENRVVEQWSHGSSTRKWLYTYAPGQATAQNPEGGSVTYLFDERKRNVGQIDEEGRAHLRIFDPDDRLQGTSSPASYSTYREYDGKHNVKVVYDELTKTTKFEYDASSNLTKVTDPLNNITTLTNYTSARVPQTITRPGGAGMETFTYSGDRVQEHRLNGMLLSTRYYADTSGPVRKPKKPWKIEYRAGTASSAGVYSSSELETEEFTYTNRGDLHTFKDRRGSVTTYHYDERRRLWKTEVPGSLETDPASSITRSFTLSDQVEAATSPRGHTTDFGYTVLNKLETSTLPAAGGAARHVITQVYDLADRVTDIINPGLRLTHMELNDAGQVTQVTLQNGLTISTLYDEEGRPWKTTDGLNRTTTTTYSARSEVTRVTQPDTNFISKLYDAAGRNTRITNRLGRFWTPAYDGANRLTSLKSPSPSNRTSTTVYTAGYFDLTKSPVFVQPKDTFTTPGGRKTEVLYDAARRPVTRNLYPTPTATTPTHTLTSAFDPNGNVLTVTEAGEVLTRTYDQRSAVRTYTNALNETFVYRYDASGNLVQLTLPGSKAITYVYDELNRLDSITDWANRVTDFTYDAATGDFAGYTRPNNTQRVLGYDNGGRLTRIHERTTAGRLIAMIRLGFDAAGRADKRFLIPRPIPASFPALGYTYSADNWISGLSHDGDGNLLQVPAVPASTSSPAVAQASIGLLSVSGSVSNAVWDLRSRLQSLSLADGSTMSFTYDAENLRLTKSIGTQITRYTQNPHGLSGMSETTLEHLPDGRTRYYVWGGPSGILYDVTAPAGGGAETLRYYHSDQVGSTLALTNGSGAVISRFDYTAYGLMTRREGDADTPFLYNGAFGVMTDHETGLIHMRARYYHPWMARFLNEDPIGFSGGTNWYAFADGNPVVNLDPLGLYIGSMLNINGPGAHTSFSLSNGTNVVARNIQDFTQQIQTSASGSVKIVSIDVWGHGNRNQFQIAPDAYVQVAEYLKQGGGRRWQLDITDIQNAEGRISIPAEVLQSAMAENGHIDLHCCNTAREWVFGEGQNVARELSAAVPGVPVTGARGFGFGHDDSEVILRIPRTYQTPKSASH